jgi:uncharacterized RDD family membrane protein YckC
MGIARFEKRIGAYLIDIISSILFALPLTIFFAYLSSWQIPWYFDLWIAQLLSWFFYALFTTCSVHWSNGYTLGGLIFGIKSVHRDGKRISVGDAITKGICIGILPFVIVNAIYMLVVHTEITIFDRMTDTIVIDIRVLE